MKDFVKKALAVLSDSEFQELHLMMWQEHNRRLQARVVSPPGQGLAAEEINQVVKGNNIIDAVKMYAHRNSVSLAVAWRAVVQYRDSFLTFKGMIESYSEEKPRMEVFREIQREERARIQQNRQATKEEP